MEDTLTYSWRSAIQAVTIVYREYYQEQYTTFTNTSTDSNGDSATSSSSSSSSSFSSSPSSTSNTNSSVPALLHSLIHAPSLPPSTRIQEISEGIIEECTKQGLSLSLSTSNSSFLSFPSPSPPHQLMMVLIIIHTLGIILNDTLSIVAPLKDHILYWEERINATKGLNPLATTIVELWEGGPIEWYTYVRNKLSIASISMVSTSLSSSSFLSLPHRVNDATPSSSSTALSKSPPSSTLSMLPHEYVAQLQFLHTFLVRLIGLCRSRLALLAAVTTDSLRQDGPLRSSVSSASSSLSSSVSIMDKLVLLASRSVVDISNCIVASSEHAVIMKDWFRTLSMNPSSTTSSSSSSSSSPQLSSSLALPPVSVLCRTIVHTLSQWSTVTVPYLHRTIIQLSARPGYQRYWLRYTIVSIGAIYGLYYLNKNHKSIKETFLTTSQSIQEFYNDHIGTPISQMMGEIFGGKRFHIADNNGLDLAKKELEKSIHDFNMNFFNAQGKNINTLFPTLTMDEAKILAQKLDMRTITESYANTINRPFTGIASGELLRIMFIQVSFIKKELLSALAAIDNLLMDNQFNLAIVATIPGILFISGSLNFIQNMYSLATAPLDTSDVRLKLRLMMRDLYRTLSLAKNEQRLEHSLTIDQNRTHQPYGANVSTAVSLTKKDTLTPSTTVATTLPLPSSSSSSSSSSSLYATILPCTCSCICGIRESFDKDTHWAFAQLPGLLENVSKITIASLAQKQVLVHPSPSTASAPPRWTNWFTPFTASNVLSTNTHSSVPISKDNFSSIVSSSSFALSPSSYRTTTCSCCACDRIGQMTLLTYQLGSILFEHFRRSQPFSNTVANTINGISWSEYMRLCEDMMDLCRTVAVIRIRKDDQENGGKNNTQTDVDVENALTVWHRLHSTYSILGGLGQNDYSILSRLTRLT